MALFRHFAAASACCAALSLVAAPASALDMPRTAPMIYKGDKAENWGRRRHRDRDGIDAGDVLAGVLILGYDCRSGQRRFEKKRTARRALSASLSTGSPGLPPVRRQFGQQRPRARWRGRHVRWTSRARAGPRRRGRWRQPQCRWLGGFGVARKRSRVHLPDRQSRPHPRDRHRRFAGHGRPG